MCRPLRVVSVESVVSGQCARGGVERTLFFDACHVLGVVYWRRPRQLPHKPLHHHRQDRRRRCCCCCTAPVIIRTDLRRESVHHIATHLIASHLISAHLILPARHACPPGYIFCCVVGPIPWGHSGPLCHALSLSSLSWTSMRRWSATVPLATSCEWA